MSKVGYMATSKSSSKNIEKLNFQSILNIELYLAHTKLKLDVIAGKLVKDVVNLWRWNYEKINFPLYTSCLNNKRPLSD